MASIKTEVLATRLNADADRVVKRAVLQAKRVQFFIKRRAHQALRRGERFEVRDKILKLKPLLADVMLASHAVGVRRAELLQPKNEARALSLSVFDRAVDFLRKRSEGNFDAVASQYNTRAFNLLNGAADHVENSLASSVAEITAQGAHTREGIDLLNKKFESLGLGSQKTHLLETLFRTNTQLAYGAGRWDADQDPAVQEILWGYEYSAVGDDRTRETHLAMDGTTLPKDDDFWRKNWPPNGWNCRCAAVPLFESEPERRPRDSLRNGAKIEADRGFLFNAGTVYRAGPVVAAPAPPAPLKQGPTAATTGLAEALTSEEQHAVNYYTSVPAGQSVGELRRLLDGDLEPRLPIQKEFVRSFPSAVRKMPKYDGPAYRGLSLPEDSPLLRPGAAMSTSTIDSWTRDASAAHGYAITSWHKSSANALPGRSYVKAVVRREASFIDPNAVIGNPDGKEVWAYGRGQRLTVKKVTKEYSAALGTTYHIEVGPP